MQAYYAEQQESRPDGYVYDQPPFMQHCAFLRGKMDRYVNAYLNHESRAEKGLSLAMGRWGDKMRPVVCALEADILGAPVEPTAKTTLGAPKS